MAARVAAVTATLALFALACSDVKFDTAPSFVRARFDPDAKVVPMPTDVLRDAVTGRLDIPLEDQTLSDAERELYAFFATLDGWPSTMSATVEFSGPINPRSVNPDSVQVWKWSSPPQLVKDLQVTVSTDAKKITIDPPRAGWDRGTRYIAVVLGGATGVEDKTGEAVECDAPFYFLRQRQRLDTPEHQDIFPGATAAERQGVAQRLEEVREDLAPAFVFFEQQAIPRKEIAALWGFTITTHTELAIDKASERVPIPSQLLVDPMTNRIDVPSFATDTEAETEAKLRLREYDGFSISGTLLFEFSGPMDPATINPQNVALYRMDATGPAKVDADVRLMDDRLHVIMTPTQLLQPERTAYAVAVTRGVRDAAGQEVVPMPAGFLMLARSSLVKDGHSTLTPIEDADAARLEATRTRVAPLLSALGRDTLVGAWPFVTMSIMQPLQELAATPEALAVPPDPAQVKHRNWVDALLDFPLNITTFGEVNDVYYGTIKSPQFLDPATRAWRTDGSYSLEDIQFIVTARADLQGPVPIVIFGHSIGAERRFLLAIADALAREGFVGIAIDLPYHGERSACVNGPPSLGVNPISGGVVSLGSCDNNATCNDVGRCVDGSGRDVGLATWQVVSMPLASGLAFFDFGHIARTRDHVKQTIIDLSAVERSLRKGNWQSVLGQPIDPTRIYFAGESLGGVAGATWLSVTDGMPRAVLNAAGADLVDVLRASQLFGPEVDKFLMSQNIAKGSFEEERALDVARWFVDSIDPQSVTAATARRQLFVQMGTRDSIIPNWSTQRLSDMTLAMRRDYSGDHLFLVVPVEDDFDRAGRDLARFLARGMPQ